MTKRKANKPLVKWLEKTGKTQTWLANKIGVAACTVSLYANGYRPIPVPVGLKIEQLTKIPFRTLYVH